MEKLKKIKETFDSLPSQSQWEWLLNLDNKDEFTIYLDNDCTSLYFKEDVECDYSFCFKHDIGDREGVLDLLQLLGFNVEYV
jgi:hypothetical protein